MYKKNYLTKCDLFQVGSFNIQNQINKVKEYKSEK